MLYIARTVLSVLSQDVRPSVYLSVTHRYSVETAIHIIKLLSLSGSQTLLVFRTKRYGNNPTGTPVSNAVGMEKSQFSTNNSLYLRNDTKESHSYYGMRIGNRTQAFNDPERLLTQISRSRHYLTLNISQTARGTDIVTPYTWLTQGCHLEWS